MGSTTQSEYPQATGIGGGKVSLVKAHGRDWSGEEWEAASQRLATIGFGFKPTSENIVLYLLAKTDNDEFENVCSAVRVQESLQRRAAS